jgi:YVTN family beta-propeller protein
LAATAKPIVLPSGFSLTPAGREIALPGDMPSKILVSPDGNRVLVETSGYHDHGVYVINPASGEVVQSVNLQKLWPGMAFSADGKAVYVAGGQVYDTDHWNKSFQKSASTDGWANSFRRSVVAAPWDGSSLGAATSMQVGDWDSTQHFAAGAAVDASGRLFMLDQDHDSVVLVGGGSAGDAAASALEPGGPSHVVSAIKVGYRPYAIACSPDGHALAVSNWGDKSVSLIDARSLAVTGTVSVGSHPNELAYGKDGRLFVVCAGSNCVSVIQAGQVVETINTALTPNAAVGSTPDALAVSPDETRLYVANADNNDVAVVDISSSESKVLGFIPTAWYPSALGISPDGAVLYVGCGKGAGALGPNYPARTDVDRQSGGPANAVKQDYIGYLLGGAIAVVPVPDADGLAADTKLVLADTPYTRAAPRPAKDGLGVLTSRKIKHVIFIIRENRTYDQEFGDMGRGASDPDLCIFGRAVTPNSHALADRYVLFDNLYCNGEVSEDGHQWCDAAYATDFTEKAWVSSYSGREEPDADERLTASPAGYLWDNCAKHNLSYYSYGEMAEFKSSPNSPPKFEGESTLAGHCSEKVEEVQWGKQHDTERAAVFIQDLKDAEKTGKWPDFVVMWLGEDHTQGLKAGAFTPAAMVAGNDLGLGQIVDAVSHSWIWKDTAIFVIEDDAQNGPDHVDAHRTVGLLISPYAKRGIVDSTPYTTSSFVRTIEMALGLPTMTQFDAGATPMTNALTDRTDMAMYTPLTPQVDMEARNPDATPGAKLSAKLDLSGPDKADPDALNRILWMAMKPGRTLPAPVRSYAP